MVKITAKIDGMMCGMCEAHMNDAVRAAFDVKSVKSSHKKGETVIVAENEIPEDALKAAVEKTGYKLISATSEPYKKKGLFSF
ncbi:MAG: cation transporter [Firmicutes bacterium]|nr:cation transporter [Bacillota bacterium]